MTSSSTGGAGGAAGGAASTIVDASRVTEAGGRVRIVREGAVTRAQIQQLIGDELEPVVIRDADGRPVTGDGERSRFSSGRDTSFVRLAPELVLEVRYDQMEGDRFRHTVQFERWRPDRDPASCTYEQLESISAYDVGAVLD